MRDIQSGLILWRHLIIYIMLPKEAHLSASTLVEVSEGHPSCLHTTLASSVPKLRSQALPKVPVESLSTSSLPSHWLEPPCSLTVTAFAVEWKMRNNSKQFTTILTVPDTSNSPLLPGWGAPHLNPM